MNILFLSIGDFNSIYDYGIYPDLLREFMNHGHEVYVVSSLERRKNRNTEIIIEDRAHLLKVRVGNITKTNLIEKGISTVLIGYNYKNAINKYFKDVKFDLILYSTPPITLAGVVEAIKKKNNANTYLLLKDIFPQNAVDMGMFSKSGLKGLIYKYFRNKEKRLYRVSDYIGCMSQANVDYVIKHNKEINPDIVEICPNCIEVIDKSVNLEIRNNIRKKYDIPLDKKVFVYGGNLGKPQGIDFLIKCIYSQRNNEKAYFLVVGDGTEYKKLEQFVEEYSQDNLKLMKRLPKEDYDKVVAACDVGMIFLDYRFTIPNFPSRLLSYMQASLPVLACTDSNTDIGDIIEYGKFGWWCESDSIFNFDKLINKILKSNLTKRGRNAKKFLEKYYSVKMAYNIIMKG